MSEASPQEMNRFVSEVNSFMKNYARLIQPGTRADVYATGNSAIISDYESAVSQARILKRTIEATTGAWNAAKAAYSTVTGITSTGIGDAIDEIRSWFGYDPATGVGGLGIVQLPAAAWIAGIISAAYLLNATMNKIFIAIEATKITRADPTISRERALALAKSAVSSPFFGNATLPLLTAGALALYLVLK